MNITGEDEGNGAVGLTFEMSDGTTQGPVTISLSNFEEINFPNNKIEELSGNQALSISHKGEERIRLTDNVNYFYRYSMIIDKTTGQGMLHVCSNYDEDDTNRAVFTVKSKAVSTLGSQTVDGETFYNQFLVTPEGVAKCNGVDTDVIYSDSVTANVFYPIGGDNTGSLGGSSMKFEKLYTKNIQDTGTLLILNEHVLPGLHESLDIGSSSYRWRNVYISGDLKDTSDVKLKKDIVDAPDYLEKLNQIRVVNYNWKRDADADPDNPQIIGVIAQEVEEHFPTIVEPGETYGIKPTQFIYVLIKSVQELSKEKDELQECVLALCTELKSLKTRVEELEKIMYEV